jgi:hypothetical protein
MSSTSDSNSRPPVRLPTAVISTSDSSSRAPTRIKISEVKYPMPEMLDELKAERAAASFAMEQLDQQEIGKIFKTKSRAKSKK